MRHRPTRRSPPPAEGPVLGLALALVILGCGLVRRGRGALAGLVLLLGPLAIAPWKLWLDVHHQPTSATAYRWSDLLHPVYLAERTDRLTYAAGRMFDFLADATYRSPILPLAACALIVLAPLLRELSAAVALWVAAAFLGLATIYCSSKLDVHWYVSTSASRVVSSLPIVVGAVLPLLLWTAIEREGARPGPGSARPSSPGAGDAG